MSGKCETCRWWRDIGDEDDKDVGMCHRYPPTFTWAMADNVYAKYLNGGGDHGMFPLVGRMDYCGEYQERKDGDGCDGK